MMFKEIGICYSHFYTDFRETGCNMFAQKTISFRIQKVKIHKNMNRPSPGHRPFRSAVF